jgi:hypothetical protein
MFPINVQPQGELQMPLKMKLHLTGTTLDQLMTQHSIFPHGINMNLDKVKILCSLECIHTSDFILV